MARGWARGEGTEWRANGEVRVDGADGGLIAVHTEGREVYLFYLCDLLAPVSGRTSR